MATEPSVLSACIDASGSAIGMPQLCPEWIGNQIFWLVLTLLAIFFVLSRIALPRIAAVLSERASTISNDIALAEELKLKAEAAEVAYTKALNDARAEAQSIAAQTRADIQAELDEALAKADAEIAAKAAESETQIALIRENAMQNIEKIANDVALDIVAVLGGKGSAKDVSTAVDERLKG